MNDKVNLRQLPLSNYQKTFFFEWTLAPSEITYNISYVTKLKGKLHSKVLKKACEIFIERNEVVHSKYSEDGLLCFYGNFSIDDFFTEQNVDKNSPIETQLAKYLYQPFNLIDGPLLKLYLLHDSLQDESYFFFVAHHIICDAVWVLQFLKQVENVYNSILSTGHIPQLPADFTKFSDAVKVEQKIIDYDYRSSAEKFWLEFIGDIPLNVRLPRRSNSFPLGYGNQLGDKSGEFIYFDLTKEQSSKLRLLSLKKKATLFILLSSLYGLTVSKFTRLQKFFLSYPVNMRPPGCKEVAGCFVNNILLKFEIDKVNTLTELLLKLSEQRQDVKQYQGYTLSRIVSDQRKYKKIDTDDAFNLGFSQSYLNVVPLELTGTKTFPIDISWSKNTLHDISLLYDDRSEIIRFKLEYKINVLDAPVITGLIEGFKKTINDALEFEEIQVKSHIILNEAKFHQIIHQWSTSKGHQALDSTIHSLFEKQSHKTPHHLALSDGHVSLTYHSLNEKSDRLALYIRKRYQQETNTELMPDTLIPLCVNRNVDAIVGILGILKSGAAYVPIDPLFPKKRIQHILNDTAAPFVLTQKVLLPLFANEKVINIDLSEPFYRVNDLNENIPPVIEANDLAYVIYTSGTTGKPKGTMIEHRGIINLIQSQNELLEIEENDVVIQFAPFIFDASVSEIFTALTKGAKLVIATEEVRRDATLLADFLYQNHVNVATIPPVILAAMTVRNLPKLKTIIVAGETCPLEVMRAWSVGRRFINAYGPTEATVCASMHNYRNGDSNINIGRPISNLQIYILDYDLNPVPIGAWGELYIGGIGVARGYLNNEDLTKKRFIDNPFTTAMGLSVLPTKLYKTGDIARWNENADIEYIGREDNQVKIRGYRIELSEIEEAMNRIDGIDKTHVIVKEHKTNAAPTKLLIAYYIVSNKKVMSEQIILEELAKNLPEYMLPVKAIKLDRFPLTPNGKIDKTALPDPEFSKRLHNESALSEIEKVLVPIWRELLGKESISVNDDFFRIGGDSILSILLSTRIRQSGLHCHARDIFLHRTIRNLSKSLKPTAIDRQLKDEQGILSGAIGLLPIQQWFINNVRQGLYIRPEHWNQSFLIRVPPCEIGRLNAILSELVTYHDCLRIQYRRDGEWIQIYDTTISLPELKTLNVSQYDEAQLQQLLTEWQSGFSLETGPLFQIGYLDGFSDGTARIFFALHHMISDVVSWQILSQDIRTLYDGSHLPTKGSSYRQWVDCVRNYPAQHPEEFEIWNKLLSDLPKIEFEGQIGAESNFVSLELNHEITDRLLNFAPRAYSTEINDLLLTAFAYALSDISGSLAFGLTLEGHGRENIDPSIDNSRTLGWFTTLFPLKIELQRDIENTIIGVKRNLRTVPTKGLGFGAFASESRQHVSFDNLPPITFNYFGQLDSKNKFWEVTSEKAGTAIHHLNKSGNLISANGMIAGSRLKFFIETRLDNKIVNKLSNSFQNHIETIVTYCEKKIWDRGIGHTLEDFPTASLSQELLSRLDENSYSFGNEIIRIYNANSLQRGFIYHALSQTEDNAYRLQLLYDYHETLNIELYLKAWEHCIDRYPILRTAFNWEDELLQIIYRKGNLRFEIHDLSNFSTTSEKNEHIELIRKNDRELPFDLTAPTILRLHIFKHSENYFTTLLTQHHIIADGWSGPILLSTLHEYYQLLCNNKEVPVEEDTSYYRAQEYIHENKLSIVSYWQKVMNNISEINDIDTLVEQPINAKTYRKVNNPSVVSFEIEGETYKRVKDFTIEHGITTNVIVMFLWHKMLQVFSNSKQTIVGTTISGRDLPIEGINDSVGLYINTLPLLVNWDNENDIISQLQHIQAQITDLYSHSFADLASLHQDGERLFHSLYVFENYPDQRSKSDKQMKIIMRNYVDGIDYPFSIMVMEYTDQLVIKIKYDGKFLSEEKALQHTSTLNKILDFLLNRPYDSHNNICLLLNEDYERFIYKWNITDKIFPKDKTLHQLFEEQTAKTPNAVALVSKGQELTYRDLNERSNQLARHLINQYERITGGPMTRGVLIAICLDRSVELVASILAVLKTGAAYAPIDPNYPKRRMSHILEETQSGLVITQKKLSNCSIELPEEKIVYADFNEDYYLIEGSENLNLDITAQDLAYVIFTSGTTGKPKGSLIEHHSLVNLNHWYIEEFNLRPDEKTIICTEICFDLTQKNYFAPLITGCTVVLPSSGFNPKEIAEDVLINKVKRINCTPSAFVPIIETIYDIDSGYEFDYIFLGGEPIPDNLVKLLRQRNPKGFLVNTYGPTECSDVTTFYRRQCQDLQDSVPLGKPVYNFKHYVLDQNLVPVPVGVLGELFIGGEGIGRGYLNNSQMTAERFLDNPFATASEKEKKYTKLYKTGDLVRLLVDGNLEYVGRNDDQVKIRGYRIELSEIENVLSNIPGIKQSCILVRERNTEVGPTKHLLGYYVLDPDYSSGNDLNILDSWKNLYEVEYDKSIEEEVIESDFTGWNSYINGKQIPIDQMEFWRKDILTMIRSVRPRKVLEIGVGSGLLMYPLLSEVEKYTGLDISNTIIQRHKNKLKDKGFNVDFYHLKADEVDRLPGNSSYDTIIMNSVCQYFPSIFYFRLVLNKILKTVGYGGTIFIGDIRNYNLVRELITEKLDYDEIPYSQFDIERAVQREPELLISPEYFIELEKHYKNIKVQIRERNDSYQNELSKYRYDVIISIRGPIQTINNSASSSFVNSSKYFNIPFLNQLSREDISKKLLEVLPEYMVPATLIRLESFPLTVNGKLDKRALPDPEVKISHQYVAPRNIDEEAICRMWEELVGVNKAGITDDFFMIGGNSILAIQASHRMTKLLRREVKVTDVFVFRDIKTILANLKSTSNNDESVEWQF